MDLRKLFESFDLPDGWTVVRVLRNGREEVLATGLSLDDAADLATSEMRRCHVGETISIREGWSPA